MRIVHLIAAAAALTPVVASAAETVAYTYDAKGRLIRAAHSGSVNDGVVVNYAFDQADNRTNVTVSGASAGSPAQRIIVVPLGPVNFAVIGLPPQ